MNEKTIRILYGTALLLFLLGAVDVSLYILQQHENFEDGLSDELALAGLGVWWVIAGGLAGFTHTRSKKAAG